MGSFLHNLKIPVTGMIMSLVSVWILISFVQIWKERGLVWRAGLICAMMKSISPSAVILGPMIGIMSEALLIEIFIFLFGRNLFAYAIGGAFAVLSTLIQKVLSLLIKYGLDLVRIAEDLYRFAVKQINLEHVSPGYLISIIAVIYVVTGFSGAIAGFFTGRRYVKTDQASPYERSIDLQPGSLLFNRTTGHDYSVILLFINILSITGILVLLNFNLLIPALAASLLYLVFSITRYNNSLKRLKKASFWIAFLVITFTATFLWDRVASGVFFSMNGLVTGLKMNVRAAVMVIGFASISVELKNPVIKSVLYNKGFANLYQSLNLSFSALPFIISNIRGKGNNTIITSVRQSQGLFRQAETIYGVFEKEHLRRPDVVIITGELHQGKTTFARFIVNKLIEKEFKPGGFLSVGINEEQRRSGFILHNINTADETELCSDRKDENRLNYGRYYFDRDAIAEGEKILNKDNLTGKDLIVIDEIGPLELRGHGWSSAIDSACQTMTLPHLWVIRRSIVPDVVKKWSVGSAYVFDIGTDTKEEALEKTIELISAYKKQA